MSEEREGWLWRGRFFFSFEGREGERRGREGRGRK